MRIRRWIRTRLKRKLRRITIITKHIKEKENLKGKQYNKAKANGQLIERLTYYSKEESQTKGHHWKAQRL